VRAVERKNTRKSDYSIATGAARSDWQAYVYSHKYLSLRTVLHSW